MKYINIYIIISLLLSFLFSCFNCFTFGVEDNYEKYCFNKYISQDDQITFSFVLTSYPKELIHVELTFRADKHDSKKIIYQVLDKDEGSFKSEKLQDIGYYEVCFFSKKGVKYYVSMEFYTLFEDNNIKKLATDKEIKTINKDIFFLKNALNDIEMNSRHINSRNFEHFAAMSILINSIKRLTYLKIFVVAAISLFQIYIIRKFFGPDKRVTTIKGGFNDKEGVL